VTRPVVIVDTETTSLTPDYGTGSGVIWELALIGRADGSEHLWRMKPDLSVADPQALSVGRYYERTEGMRPWTLDGTADLARPQSEAGIPVHCWSSAPKLAAEVTRMLDGKIIVAANPAFDAGFLSAFLRANGEAPTWHYRLRDIGSMAWGWLAAQHAHGLYFGEIPAIDASTDELARALGVDPLGFDRHSALGDCRLVAAMLDVIEGGGAS
jgi:hypothetical protein